MFNTRTRLYTLDTGDVNLLLYMIKCLVHKLHGGFEWSWPET